MKLLNDGNQPRHTHTQADANTPKHKRQMNTPETTTTERIKSTLGASYTILEVKEMLANMRATSAKQAPLFDGRLLDRIARLESALATD